MKRNLFGIMGLVLALLVWAVPGVQATPYDGAWEPNDSAFLIFDIASANPSDVTLHIFDWGIDTNSMSATNSMGVLTGNGFISLQYHLTGSDWFLYNNMTGARINLGTSKTFGFFFTKPNGTGGLTQYLEYDIVQPYAGADLYILNSNSMSATVSDVSPVPLPGTLALLFPCILGILGIGWRKNREV